MDFVLGAIITLVIILISMMLHEIAHGLVAYWLGDTTAKDDGRLTLNPLKHLDPYLSIILPMILYIIGASIFGGAKPVPVDSRNLKGGVWGMALVALAGPFANLLLAFVGFLIYRFAGNSEIAFSFVTINLGFMIFNLIPIPPLDGSRILYAIMPDMVRDFMTRMERYGFIVIYALVLFGGNLFLNNLMTGGMAGIWNFFVLITG